MEEHSPCPPYNPKQKSKEGLAPQQNRNSAPIAHRKGQETRKRDAMTAPLADHHTQDPQQNRMHKWPHVARTLELNDNANSATLPKYYPNDNHTNNPHDNNTTLPNNPPTNNKSDTSYDTNSDMKSNSNTTTQLIHISRDKHTDHEYEASPTNNLYDETLP